MELSRTPLEAPPLPVNLARVRRYTWWSLVPFAPVMAGVTVLLLVTVWDRPAPVTAVLVGLVAVIAVATTYLLHRATRLERLITGWDRSTTAAVAIGAGALVVAVALAGATGGVGVEWGLVTGLVAGAVAIMLPTGRRLPVLLGAAVAAGAVTAALGTGLMTLIAVGGVSLTGWALWQTWWYYETAWHLDRARTQAAELAVANERLRFAAELHDVQGHHLQVIALKSELATRLAATDPSAAAAEMRQVQQLAREALTETRSLVGGYRMVSLATEIANATRVLAAADVDARPRISATGDGAGEVERLLGLVVREATTNILRHADASRAHIELDRSGGELRLRVVNDGAGGTDRDPAGGTGLPALAERLAAAGGSLRWGRDGDEFTLTATVPAGGPA